MIYKLHVIKNINVTSIRVYGEITSLSLMSDSQNGSF